MAKHRQHQPSLAASRRLSGVYIVLAACWVAWWCCVVFDDSDESAQGNNVPDDADAEADAIEQKAKEIYERDESACSHKASPCFQLVFDGLWAFPSHPGLVQAGLTLLELQHNGDGDLRAAIDLIGAALAKNIFCTDRSH